MILEGSTPYTFSQVGDFDYADTVEYEEGFVMSGNIKVINQESNTPIGNAGMKSGTTSNSNSTQFDTVGVLMVPSMDVQTVVAGFQNAGFGIDSIHNFKDLRGGQGDTGDEQTLLVWTANGIEMSEITSELQQISEELTYE